MVRLIAASSYSFSGVRLLLAGVGIFLACSLLLRLGPMTSYSGGRYVVFKLGRYPAAVLAAVGLALILLGHA